jgi:hypothetical protein
MISTLSIRLVTLAAAGAVALGHGVPLQGQTATPPTQPASASPKSTKRVSIAKSVFGDAGMIVNARDDGFIEIAAAGPNKTVLLQLRTMAARAWVDSTARMLRARVRRSNTPRTYRSDIEEHGTAATMAVTRKVTAGESEYSLFFSDDPLSGFTVPIEKSEADVFVAQVRRAVATSAKLAEPPDTSTATGDSAAPASDSAAAKPKSTKKAPAKKPVAPPAGATADSTKKPATS